MQFRRCRSPGEASDTHFSGAGCLGRPASLRFFRFPANSQTCASSPNRDGERRKHICDRIESIRRSMYPSSPSVSEAQDGSIPTNRSHGPGPAPPHLRRIFTSKYALRTTRQASRAFHPVARRCCRRRLEQRQPSAKTSASRCYTIIPPPASTLPLPPDRFPKPPSEKTPGGRPFEPPPRGASPSRLGRLATRYSCRPRAPGASKPADGNSR
jgi:hypothetical protein